MKELISKNYSESWEAKTSGFQPRPERLVSVVGTGRPGSIGDGIAEQLSKRPNLHILRPHRDELDVTNPMKIDEYFNRRQVDTLILSHGTTYLDWFEKQTTTEIRDVLTTNLIGAALTSNIFVKHTIRHPWLKYIVFIGSMAHRNVLNASAPYCASKAGLAHLSRCLAWELAPKGYRVFCVHPSNTANTPMTNDTIEGIMAYRGLDRQSAYEYWGAVRAMPRWLRASDIAQVVEFCITDEAAEFLCGTDIELTGGQR